MITEVFDIKFTEKESVKLDGCCVRGFNRASRKGDGREVKQAGDILNIGV